MTDKILIKEWLEKAENEPPLELLKGRGQRIINHVVERESGKTYNQI